ncbi:MAG: ABC transporter substrate-binding protein [Ruminococcus sp.]|nr:ABC transporter substrate-binding protein [Ruminococcus sp.]
MKKRVVSFLLALTLSLGLCACGNNADQADTNQTDAAEAKSEEETGESGTSSEEPPKGGDLVIIDTAEVTHTVWYNLQSYNDKFQYMITIYETLFRVDDAGNVIPWLAKSYEADQENLKYTIELNEGIQFHDGTELTGEVAAWCLDVYKEKGIKSAAFFSNIDSIEAAGDYTFEIKLSQWDATIPYSLARECGIMTSQKAYEEGGEEGCEQKPVGTGPFAFESMSRDTEKVFTRFDDYWQGEPYLDTVTVKIYSDSLVAQAAMQNDDAQMMYCTDYKLVDELKASGCTAALGVPSQIALLCFNCLDEEDNPFYDVKVRQAVSYAIDKEALIDSIYSGYAAVTNQFAPEGSVFYNTETKGYEYDVEKAKELLKEAGYEDGFKTTCIVRNDIMQVNCVTAIQAMLAEIGIEMEVDVQDTGDFSQNLTKWSTGMFFHTSSLPIDVTNQMSSMFRQGLSGIVLGLDSLLRPDELDAAIVGAVGAKTPEEAQESIREAQTILIDDICDLNPVVTVYQPIIKSSKLHDDGVNDAEYSAGTLHKAWIEK